MRQPTIRRRALLARTLAVVAVCACPPALLTGCRDDAGSPTAPNVVAEETIAQVAARLTALEREKMQLAFGTPARTSADVARFVSMFAPEFQSIDLGPTGVSQSRYADLQSSVSSFPVMPYAITNMRALAANARGVVVTYQVALQTPMGVVDYLASSVWSLTPSGEWKTIFYQATPL